jgi:hypothetical protein
VWYSGGTVLGREVGRIGRERPSLISARRTAALAGVVLLLLAVVPVSAQNGQDAAPAPGENDATFRLFDQALNFLPTLYAGVRGLIASLLTHTLLKENPELSGVYAEAITFLTSITALYVVLEFFSLARKVVLVLLATGWGLFVVTLVVRST